MSSFSSYLLLKYWFISDSENSGREAARYFASENISEVIGREVSMEQALGKSYEYIPI